MHRVYDDEGDDGNETAQAFRMLASRVPNLLEPVADYPALESLLGPIVDVVGAWPDVMLPRLADRSRKLVLVEFARALKDAWEQRARHAGGDYRPDPNSERFPAWERPADAHGDYGTTSVSPTKITLTGLVEDWWKENKRLGKARSTYVNYIQLD